MATSDLLTDNKYVDPELAEHMSKNGPPPYLDANTDVHALRAIISKAKVAMLATLDSAADSKVEETDHKIKVRDGAEIDIRVSKPLGESTGRPLLVMLHGGGWFLGDIDSEAVLCRQFAQILGGVSVNVDYRLAPENKFPTAVLDCFDAVKWAATNATAIGADPKKGFIIGGTSAGANMATVISVLTQDEKLSSPITGCFLSTPFVFNDPDTVPEKYRSDFKSRTEITDAPILHEGLFALTKKLYEYNPKSPLMSPIQSPSALKGMPPAYFQLCGWDPVRDDGIIYERMLREDYGIATKVDGYPGLPHAFPAFFPDTSFTKKQSLDSVQGLRWLLEQVH